jgi:hypothetical protein
MLGLSIDELGEVIRPGDDPSRWNPFVVASIPGSAVIAVVAPNRLGGMFRLRGQIEFRPDGRGFTIAAVSGRRRHGLQVGHELEATRSGSFRTTIRISTRAHGSLAALVSRTRLRAWHADEFDALRARVERRRAHRGAPERRGGDRPPDGSAAPRRKESARS